MKLWHPQLRLTVLAATLMLAAPGAHAFTLDNSRTNNADGSAKYADPEEQVQVVGAGHRIVRFGTERAQFNLSPSSAGGHVSPVYEDPRAQSITGGR